MKGLQKRLWRNLFLDKDFLSCKIQVILGQNVPYDKDFYFKTLFSF